jgi:hypothetical protein
MRFNYDKLLPGFIVGTTDTFTTFGAITRATEAGIKNIMNPNISSHIFLIVKEHDLIFGVEMVLPKIRMCDLNKYEYGKLGNHAVFVANPFRLIDYRYEYNYTMQESVNAWILKCHTIGIKYDIKELFKFWDLPVHDNKQKLICSELARNMLHQFEISYPPSWVEKVSPYDIQKWACNENLFVSDWKIK